MEFDRGQLRRIGLASTAAGALLCATLPVHAGDAWNPLSMIGGANKPADDSNGVIDYRPRPALVVPPSSDLPPPQASDPRSADWPKAPDATALKAAKADSRRPAPSMDSQVNGSGGPSQPVFLADKGPNCNSLAGMPMCFTTPWGQDVALPGAVKSDQLHGVVLNATPTRQYLTDPPANYLGAVPLPAHEEHPASGGTAAAAPGATAGQEPPKNCNTPGWFGCPETYNTQPGAAQTGWDVGVGKSTQQCVAPGLFGCPANPPAQTQASASVATSTAPPPAQAPVPAPAPATPPASKCATPGWFGCPEN
jgi:hypothetical protein